MSGYNMPPGVSVSDIPGNQAEPPCDVCGQHPEHCECPECPHCATYGDEECYKQGHLGYAEKWWYPVIVTYRTRDNPSVQARWFYYDGHALFTQVRDSILEYCGGKPIGVELADPIMLPLAEVIKARHDGRVIVGRKAA